jgi:predicted hydrocarbon binding protein
MGEFRAKVSIILKILMKYLISIDKAAREIPKMWRKFFTTGDAKVIELDKKQKKVILRIENYYFHPIQCRVMEGIFSTLVRMIVGEKVVCRELKCVHQGDAYHEFLLEW